MVKLKPVGGADLKTVVIAFLLAILGVILMHTGYLFSGIIIFVLGCTLMTICFVADMRYAERRNRRLRNRR